MEILVETFKLAFPTPFCIWVNYVQTFIMFPGICFAKTDKFKSSFLQDWGILLLNLNFNLGDVTGKLIG